ncbi:MAG: cation-translocating P-type ATPase [Minisyncoccia bacterium]
MDFLEKFREINRKTLEEIEKFLETRAEGLNEKEAERRLKNYGENIIFTFKINILEIIKRNFLNLFNLLLLFAGLFSFFLQESKIESFLIIFFFFLSVFISTFQDYKSSKLLEDLIKIFKNYAFVKREGIWKKIEQKFLVPGDLVKVKAGDIVPADIILTKSEDLLIDESILTGENVPVFKNEKEKENLGNILFSGSSVIKGEGEGYVIFTGKESFAGSLAKKILEIKKETIYKKILDDFAKKIFYFALLLGVLLFISNIIKGQFISIKEFTVFVIVLIVAMVPEFLPAMTVLTLSFTGKRLSKKGLLIKRLSVIEDLGTIEIIATDKTGTITTNKLKLKNIISEDKEAFIKFFLADFYFSKEETPYESAILEKIKNLPDYSDLEFIEDVPFDPLKRIEKLIVKNKNNGEIIEIIKGAPEEIIKNFFNNNEKYLDEFFKEDESGFRTLALAIKVKNTYRYLGIASFEDPLKKESFEAVKLAKKMNVEIKILTGDSSKVAKKAGLDLGIIDEEEKVITGEEIRNLSEKDLEEIVFKYHIFARLYPDDKFRIIKILKSKKPTLFLGEGINDLLALREADVSIVVDSAAEICKEEADIIMLDKDLKDIVDAVYEGRKALENIGKYIKHTMSDNFGNLISVSFLTLYLPYLPLKPLQVLLTNFLTDIPLIAFANDKVNDEDIAKPVNFDNKKLLILLLLLGFSSAIVNILAYLYIRNEDEETVRTFIFLITTLTGLLVSFLIRNKNIFIKQKFNLFIFFSVFLALVLTIIFIKIPFLAQLFDFKDISFKHSIFILILLIIFMLLTEVSKIIFYKKFPESL